MQYPSLPTGGLRLVLKTLRIVLVGRVISSTAFDPKHAFIVQNKAGAMPGCNLLINQAAAATRETVKTPKQASYRDLLAVVGFT